MMIRALLQILVIGLLITGCEPNTGFTIRNSTDGLVHLTYYDQDNKPINATILKSGQQILQVNSTSKVHFVTVETVSYEKEFVVRDFAATMKKGKGYILLVTEEDAIFMSNKDLRKDFGTY